MKSTFTFGSLFSGIGGIDLGLERAGMTCKWQVENDEFCNRVLAKHWPTVSRLTDVRHVSESTVEAVDLICGGFPCQPVSLAGKRKGDSDHRWLWPQFARVVDELQPSIVLLENVPGLLSLGGSEVAADLASLGYDAEWHCFPAAAVGAYHKRERFWCVATNANSPGVWQPPEHFGGGCSASFSEHNGKTKSSSHAPSNGRQQRRPESTWQQGRPDAAQCSDTTANAIGTRLEIGTCFGGDFAEELAAAFRSHRSEGGIWETFSTVGALASGVSERVAKLRAIGNSVVPQVAELIGKRIMRAAPASPATRRGPARTSDGR